MEPINWHTLTPEQRNEIIHEKIFGHERATKHFLAPDTSRVWSVGDFYRIRSVETWRTGGPGTPRYSQSMDAAWSVLQNMVKRYEQGPLDQFLDFAGYMFEASGWDRTGIHDDVYPGFQICIMAAKWTPEAICIAALCACGYEVVTEESRRAALAEITHIAEDAGEYD